MKNISLDLAPYMRQTLVVETAADIMSPYQLKAKVLESENPGENPALSLMNCVTQSMLFNPSKPQFLLHKNGDFFYSLWSRLNEIIYEVVTEA